MKTFEDELLSELRTVVAERADEQGRRRVRAPRGRVLIGLAASVALAVGAAVVVPLIGAQTALPAYSVTTTTDGKVKVTISSTDDPDGLERRLAKVGVKAEVEYLKAGQRCRRTPVGVVTADHFPVQVNYSRGAKADRHWFDYTIDPAEHRGSTWVIEASDEPSSEGRVTPALRSAKFLADGTFGPCVVVDR